MALGGVTTFAVNCSIAHIWLSVEAHDCMAMSVTPMPMAKASTTGASTPPELEDEFFLLPPCVAATAASAESFLFFPMFVDDVAKGGASSALFYQQALSALIAHASHIAHRTRLDIFTVPSAPTVT